MTAFGSGLNLFSGRLGLTGLVGLVLVPTLRDVRYQAVRWLHPPGKERFEEPVEIFSEIGPNDLEVRKVEVFQSRVAYAHDGYDMAPTVLGRVQVPPLEDINALSEFEGRSITADEFEEVWERAVSEAGPVPRFASPTDEAHARLTEEVVAVLQSAYDEIFVFPFSVELVNDQRTFPGVEHSMLVLSTENQGVCTWGLVHDGPDAGQVQVAMANDVGVGATTKYCDDLESFVESRTWDVACMNSPSVIQAQTTPLQSDALELLRDVCSETVTTFGWPSRENLRFQTGEVRVMVWSDDDRADWWICGPIDELDQLLPDLGRAQRDLIETAWSDIPDVSALLAKYQQ